MTGKLLLMISQKCLAGTKFQLKIEVPNFNYSNASVLFRSPSEKKKYFCGKNREWFLLLLLANTYTQTQKK